MVCTLFYLRNLSLPRLVKRVVFHFFMYDQASFGPSRGRVGPATLNRRRQEVSPPSWAQARLLSSPASASFPSLPRPSPGSFLAGLWAPGPCLCSRVGSVGFRFGVELSYSMGPYPNLTTIFLQSRALPTSSGTRNDPPPTLLRQV